MFFWDGMHSRGCLGGRLERAMPPTSARSVHAQGRGAPCRVVNEGSAAGLCMCPRRRSGAPSVAHEEVARSVRFGSVRDRASPTSSQRHEQGANSGDQHEAMNGVWFFGDEAHWVPSMIRKQIEVSFECEPQCDIHCLFASTQPPPQYAQVADLSGTVRHRNFDPGQRISAAGRRRRPSSASGPAW